MEEMKRAAMSEGTADVLERRRGYWSVLFAVGYVGAEVARDKGELFKPATESMSGPPPTTAARDMTPMERETGE
jgi:hypothetical protein